MRRTSRCGDSAAVEAGGRRRSSRSGTADVTARDSTTRGRCTTPRGRGHTVGCRCGRSDARASRPARRHGRGRRRECLGDGAGPRDGERHGRLLGARPRERARQRSSATRAHGRGGAPWSGRGDTARVTAWGSANVQRRHSAVVEALENGDGGGRRVRQREGVRCRDGAGQRARRRSRRRSGVGVVRHGRGVVVSGAGASDVTSLATPPRMVRLLRRRRARTASPPSTRRSRRTSAPTTAGRTGPGTRARRAGLGRRRARVRGGPALLAPARRSPSRIRTTGCASWPARAPRGHRPPPGRATIPTRSRRGGCAPRSTRCTRTAHRLARGH